MRKITFIFLAIGLLNICALCSKYNDEDYALLLEKLGTGGSGSYCIDKHWYNSTACNSTKTQNMVFTDDGTGNQTGTGYADNPDCNNVCDPIVWPFTYAINGNTCTLYYDQNPPDVNCGGTWVQPNPPAVQASFTFTCSETTLVTDFGTFTDTP